MERLDPIDWSIDQWTNHSILIFHEEVMMDEKDEKDKTKLTHSPTATYRNLHSSFFRGIA